MRIIALVAAVPVAIVATAAWGSPLPPAKACALFPADNAWNRRVDTLPVKAGSGATVAAIGAAKTMHADFGSGLWNGGPIGIPITVVGKAQRKTTVAFEFADESDKGPYPIPPGVRIEGGAASDGDRHALRARSRIRHCPRWVPDSASSATSTSRDFRGSHESSSGL